VRIKFATNQLTALYITGRTNGRIPTVMTDPFFEATAIIAAAAEERDVQALALIYAAPQHKDCKLLHLHGNFYLLTRFSGDENGLQAEILDIVEQP
jgi:hypothetical protein